MFVAARVRRLALRVALAWCCGSLWWGNSLICAAESDDAATSVWLISTRSVGCPDSCGEEVQGLAYYKLERNDNCWRSSSACEFHDEKQPKLPTIFVVHGNRYKADEVVDDAWPVYERLEADPERKPYRLVIWSWPSQQVCRRRRVDTQLKAQRTEAESFYLAGCLNRIDPEMPLNLVGFSFGARIITGALHLMGGGHLEGHVLEHRCVQRRQSVNAILVAAAIDSDWLLPHCYHGKALDQLNRLLVTKNCCDSALRWYPAMYRRGGPSALGFVGPECGGLEPSELEKMEVLDLTCAAGKTHDWMRYIAVPCLQDRLSSYTK